MGKRKRLTDPENPPGSLGSLVRLSPRKVRRVINGQHHQFVYRDDYGGCDSGDESTLAFGEERAAVADGPGGAPVKREPVLRSSPCRL